MSVYDPNNPLHHKDMTAPQRVGATIVNTKLTSSLPFELILVIQSSQMYLKIILRMLLTKTFGPNFKLIASLFEELVKFYVLWFIILFAFTSAGMLLFSEISGWDTFFHAIQTNFDYALGSWATKPYCDGGNDSTLCIHGKIYLFIFTSINVVLLLNLIIGILSSIYAYYEDKKVGLYYEVLLQKFATMEFDEKYGAIACA